jgi:hypothetical protein
MLTQSERQICNLAQRNAVRGPMQRSVVKLQIANAHIVHGQADWSGASAERTVWYQLGNHTGDLLSA